LVMVGRASSRLDSQRVERGRRSWTKAVGGDESGEGYER
jgi:hypothetical protein